MMLLSLSLRNVESVEYEQTARAHWFVKQDEGATNMRAAVGMIPHEQTGLGVEGGGNVCGGSPS